MPFRRERTAQHLNEESGHLNGCRLTGERDRSFHSRFGAKEVGAGAMPVATN